MTIFDLVVALVLAVSFVIGFRRGFVREVFALLSWSGASYVSAKFGHAVAGWFAQPADSMQNLIVAYILLFVVTWALLMMVTLLLTKAAAASSLSPLDRALGGVFGIVRGLVIVVAVALVCRFTAMPRQEFWTQAWLSPVVAQLSAHAKDVLPEELSKDLPLDELGKMLPPDTDTDAPAQ